MSDWQIITAVVAGYLLVNLAVGLIPGNRSSDTVTGYVAGDRNFGTVVMYFVTGATIFSAFAFLGGPGWAYSRGGAVLYILAYGVLGMAPFMAIGPWSARLGRKHGYVTQASMLSHRFSNRWVAVAAGTISVIAMVPYVALQMKGAGIVVEQVTGGRISIAAGAAAAYIVVLVYVWRSGVMGVGWTNVLQGVFMIAIAWTLGLYIPARLYGGVGEMFQAIESARPGFLTAPGFTGDGSAWTPAGFSSAIIVSAAGLMMWPHIFMKAFAARDDRILRRTIVLFPTFQLFLIPVFLVGFAGVLFATQPSTPDAVMPHIVLSTGLPPLVVGLFCAGALAASMSTGDALVHGAASIAVEDVYKGITGSDISEHDRRRRIRTVAMLVGVLAYAVALSSGSSLVSLLLGAYGAIVQLAPPVYAAFFWRRATGAGAVTGLIAGIAVTGLLILEPALKPWGLHEGLIGLGVNVVALVIVSLITTPPAEAHVTDWNRTARGN